MTYLRTGISLTALSLSMTTLASPVLGQEGSGRQGVLSFDQGFSYDFEDGLESTTDLGLTISSETRTQRLSFGIATELFGDFTDGSSDEFEIRNSSARIDYSRSGANSALSFSVNYREVNLGDDTFELAPGLILISEDGTLTTSGANARLETGIEGPFGLTLEALYRDDDYEDTVDPDLVDEVTTSLDALARFSLSPSLSLRARAGISRVEEDDLAGETERENRYVGLGVGGETPGGLTFAADIIFDESEVTNAVPSTTTNDGVGFDISLLQQRRNGTIGAEFSSRTDDAGRRTTAEVNRSFDLRTGALAFAIGVVDQEGVDDLQVVGRLEYAAETPRGEVSASITQDAVSDDGDTEVSTSLALAYRQEINAFSGWEAELTYDASEELIGADDDDSTTAVLAYTRDLTNEWSMRTGYEITRDSAGDTSNSVFFNIERDITFGF